jgi:hypothetical protein
MCGSVEESLLNVASCWLVSWLNLLAVFSDQITSGGGFGDNGR